MSRHVTKHSSRRLVVRFHRKQRIRKKAALQRGKVARMVVTRSNHFLYVQVIDDLKGHTLAQANTREEEFKKLSSCKRLDAAKALGQLIGRRAKEKNIEKVFFDRNGYDYHGRVKAIADGAREAGLKF